jgi:hypothetical protein
LAVKVVKTHGGSTLIKIAAPKPLTDGILRPLEKKSTLVSSTSNKHTTDQPADDKKKGATNKEVAVDPDDTDKKLRLSTKLEAK